jgi:hypothetical protein
MKFNPSSIILLSFLLMSCGQPSQQDTLREQIDKIKKDDIPKMDFAVSTFAVDSSTYWNVLSQITQKQKSGNKTTNINTEFKQNGKLVKAVNNELIEKNQFQGQVITTDLINKIALYYLLVDEQNKSSIYKISCESNGKFLMVKIDSATSNEWTEKKSIILNKN